MKNLLLIALCVGIFTACSTTKVKEEPKPAPAPTVQPAPEPVAEATPPPTAETETVQAQVMEVNPLTDPNNILSKRSIYFDFDKYLVKPEFRAMLEAHAKYLQDHPQASIRLEGNSDERGSSEYNLALGQKRAVAVKMVLNVLGIPDTRMETISFGKEKPRASGHDQASWAENRRADIVYSGE
jgi:peptidoglycan-associated lipoprotein